MPWAVGELMPENLRFIWEHDKTFLLPQFPDNERLQEEVLEFLVTEHQLTPGHQGVIALDFLGNARAVHIEEVPNETP